MARPIKPVLDYALSRGYPSRRGTDRRTFLRLVVTGAAGALAGCRPAPGSKTVPARVHAPQHTAAKRPPPGPHQAAQPTPEPPTSVRVLLAAAPGKTVTVESDDPRFLTFLVAPQRQAYLRLHVDPSNPGSPSAPSVRPSVIGRRLARYYRLRTGRRISRPTVTLGAKVTRRPVHRLTYHGDPTSLPGFPAQPTRY